VAHELALSVQAASPSAPRGLPHTRPEHPDAETAIAVTLARTQADLRAVAVLLESLYAARGYLVAGLEADLESDLILVATASGEPVGTLTLRIDGPGGLRADETYGEELDAARAQGRRVCELGRFAVAKGVRSSAVIEALFDEVHGKVRDRREVTDVFIEVNPRHAAFYRYRFGFCVAAEERQCARVHAPSVLLRLEIAAFEARRTHAPRSLEFAAGVAEVRHASLARRCAAAPRA
jgi:hypothetical protein